METSKLEMDQEMEQEQIVDIDKVSRYSLSSVYTLKFSFHFSNLMWFHSRLQEDADNPQLVVEYVMDIYKYLRFLEREQNVSPDYLAGQQVKVIVLIDSHVLKVC